MHYYKILFEEFHLKLFGGAQEGKINAINSKETLEIKKLAKLGLFASVSLEDRT